MLRTTMGRLLIDSALPADLRGSYTQLDKAGTASLFDDLARRHPEQYADVSKRLLDVARDVSYGSGGFSFGLKHMQEPTQAGALKQKLRREVDGIYARTDLDDHAKNQAVVAALLAQKKPLEDAVFGASLAEHNPLAMQVMNVGRGDKRSLNSLRGGDLLYEDHRGEPIPIPVLTPYSRGLKPVEYWAAGFGARKGVWDVKNATAQAGFFAKQLVQIAHRLLVTHEDEPAYDPTTPLGLPVATDDPANANAYLAHAVGPYPRDTLITPALQRELKAAGHDRILVRSPLVGGPQGGGVFAKDVGVREKGGDAPYGDFVGIAAAASLSEKLTQSQLSSKHSGGVAGAAQAVSGFKYINQLVQTPKTFPGGATHAQRDGRVSSITEAPQGGHYLNVAGEKHYVPQGLPLAVKEGDDVEAGDVLSAGIPNPGEIVKHKGIGEGRAHFVKAFGEAYKNSGMSAHRRNIELLTRGLIDHVEMQDALPGTHHLPGDVTHYQALEHGWEPREGTRTVPPRQALGKYLEAPVLHHTIGTKVRPSVLKDLEDFDVPAVTVHDEPPPFTPVMIRGMSNLLHDDDWMTRHLGSNLQKGTLEAVHRGRSSDTAGTSFVPAVADRSNFGRHGMTAGWQPRDGDGDGHVRDGTPQEETVKTPATVRSILKGLWT